MGAILPGTLQFIQLRDGRDEEVDALVEEQQNIMIHSPMSWHHAGIWLLHRQESFLRGGLSSIVFGCIVAGQPGKAIETVIRIPQP